MKIKWAPVNVPFHRRLEFICVCLILLIELILGPLCAIGIFCLLCFGNFYIKAICLLYLVFIYYDRQTGDSGGRGIGLKWIRGIFVWKHFINYFPIDLVKTVDLSPDRNYLICAFPHGLFSIGVAGNFCSSHSKWSELFPGIRSKCATLSLSMHMPISREFLLSCGLSSASANSLRSILKQSNNPEDPSNRDGYTSNGAILVVGGTREAFRTIPNSYKCVLKTRKGFVKIAMQTGASLIPAISFGENELYDIVDYAAGSWPRFIQDTIKHYFNFFPIHFNGRGCLQYSFGVLPRRHPITTVVGAPIHLKKSRHITEESVNEVHALFCARLIELFETHKSKYVHDCENIHLEFI